MDALFILGVVALTSAGLYVAGRRAWGLGRGTLRPALGRVLEWAGLVFVLFVLNVVTGFAAVLVLRRLTGQFISLYVNTDESILFLSVVQAVALQWWRASDKRAG